jgi:hypothetical protein
LVKETPVLEPGENGGLSPSSRSRVVLLQWVADFRVAAGPRGQLKLQQRPQLQTIYDELSSGRWVFSPNAPRA